MPIRGATEARAVEQPTDEQAGRTERAGQQQAGSADLRFCALGLFLIAIEWYPIVRQPTDRNSAPYHPVRGSDALFLYRRAAARAARGTHRA
jgi:hypothetical protein